MIAAGLILADESKKSGPIGLAVILVLCVACYFLFKSMSRHMRKVREEFPTSAPASAPAPTPAPAPAPVATDEASTGDPVLEDTQED